MQTAASSNLVLIRYSSSKVLADLHNASGTDEFYQQIAQWLLKSISTEQAINGLGRRLIAIAHRAFTFRQIEIVEQASQMLMSLPLSDQYRSIGLYYHSLNLRRQGQVAEAQTTLEGLVDRVSVQYRGRVIMSLAGLATDRGDFQSALPLYIEAGRAAYDKNWRDWFTCLTTQRMLSVIKGVDGNHSGALADLESLFPIARTIGRWYPNEFYNYLNSLAIELGEVGRLEEASNVCKIVLASPLLSAYPEWRETWDDIQVRRYRTSRSVLLLNHSALNIDNIVRLPLAERDEDASPEKSYRSPFHQQASVTVLKAWKEGKMVKEPNGDEKKDEEMDDRDVFMEIMRLSSQQGMSSKRLWEILEAVRKVTSKPDEG